MKTLVLLSIMFLSLVGLSQTSTERYNAYVNKCNTTDTVIINESGSIKIDTLLTTEYPTTPTYYGKVILNKTRIPNSSNSLVVFVDTIWNTSPSPIYAYGNNTYPTPTNYDKNHLHWFYRTKTIVIKLCKPVSYATWLANEAYYDKLLTDIKTNIKL